MTTFRTLGLLVASLALIGVAEAQKGGGKPGGGKPKSSCLELLNGTYAADVSELVYLAPFVEELADNMVAVRRDGIASIEFSSPNSEAVFKFIYTEHSADGTTQNEESQRWVGSFAVDQISCTGTTIMSLVEGESEVGAIKLNFSLSANGQALSFFYREATLDDQLVITSRGDAYKIGICPSAINASFAGVTQLYRFDPTTLSKATYTSVGLGVTTLDTEQGASQTIFEDQRFPFCAENLCQESEGSGTNEETLQFDPLTCGLLVSLPLFESSIFIRIRAAVVDSGQRIIYGNVYLDPIVPGFRYVGDYVGSTSRIQ